MTLLDDVLAAHGGLDRWQQISQFSANVTVGGAIWTMKRVSGLFDYVVMAGSTVEQYVTITPFGTNAEVATWRPDRQTVLTVGGVTAEDRPDPANAFVGATRTSPWDRLQAAYFASEANWNYFVAPFVFAQPGFSTEEIGPWQEDGEVWRRLQVTYPAAIVAHCPVQTYYFDDAAMLRRLDYSVDILGGGPAVHYASDYRTFDGITVPTKRRVYVRNPDGSPQLGSVSITVDVHDLTFT